MSHKIPKIQEQRLKSQREIMNYADAMLSRYNTRGPFGSSDWTVNPETGQMSQNIELTPSGERQFDLRNQIAESMMGQAQESIPSVSSAFDYSTEAAPIAEGNFANMRELTAPFDGQADWEAKMANIGVKPSSDAYQEVAGQRQDNAATNEQMQRYGAMEKAVPMASRLRQQRMADIAQMLGSQMLNTPAMGGAGIDITGAKDVLNREGIMNANLRNAERNANMQALASLMSGFGK